MMDMRLQLEANEALNQMYDNKFEKTLSYSEHWQKLLNEQPDFNFIYIILLYFPKNSITKTVFCSTIRIAEKINSKAIIINKIVIYVVIIYMITLYRI